MTSKHKTITLEEKITVTEEHEKTQMSSYTAGGGDKQILP